MPASKKQNYLHGAALLAVSVIIIKILGAIYKIPLANILGKEGYGHFTVAYNIYNVLLALSTAGLPIAVARMISEANNIGRINQVKKIFKVAVWSFLVLGAAGSLVLFSFPVDLAILLGDPQAGQSIAALAPAVILVCILSAFRGYTEGLQDMRPTAVSQVIEVAVKIAVGLSIVVVLHQAGKSATLMSAGAVTGTAAGSLFACVYMAFVVYRRRIYENSIQRLRPPEEIDLSSEKGGRILKTFVKIGVPIALGSCVTSIISLVNTGLILNRLQDAIGFSAAKSASLFGEYSMAQTIFNLPYALLTPLTISVIPAIAGFRAQKSMDESKSIIESSLRIATILALPMAVGMSVLAQPIMSGAYGGSQTGGSLLMIMGLSSYFVCIVAMTTAILQAGGFERLPMYTMLIGGLLNLVLSWLLLGNPKLNIYGSAIGTLVSYFLMFAANFYFVAAKMPERPRLGKVFLKPAVNCAVMGVAAWLVYPAFLEILGAGPEPERLTIIAALLAAILVGVAVYAVMTIATKTVTIDDLRLLPKGEKIAKFLHLK
ncbi:MAG: polysaccharide biosynthesis protein [Oscillospiraceae bacterium]|nr:polysaccharide biosynthesis protein [Oscillospiraceae bacterium]